MKFIKFTPPTVQIHAENLAIIYNVARVNVSCGKHNETIETFLAVDEGKTSDSEAGYNAFVKALTPLMEYHNGKFEIYDLKLSDI